jgi:hypothetical protein
VPAAKEINAMLDFLFDTELSPLWQSLTVLLGGLASLISAGAILYSMTTFKKSLATSHYSELDNMYFELLRIALDKPHLAQAVSQRSADQQAEYDIYAFMMWNFLEAIYDRCKDGLELRNTWYPIIDSEMQSHLTWLHQPHNTVKFKEKFVAFINDRHALLAGSKGDSSVAKSAA